MTDINKLQKKIKALLNKTEANGATREEMILAAEKAKDLMYKYSIDEYYILNKEDELKLVEVPRIKSGYNVKALLPFICQAFQTDHFYTKDTVSFFGFEIDLDLSTYFYKHLTDLCLKEKDEYLSRNKDSFVNGRTASANFIRGFILSVGQRLENMYRDRDKNRDKKHGLIVYEKSKIVEEEFKLRFNPETNNTKLVNYDYDTLADGFDRGKKVEIHQGIDYKQTINEIGFLN